MIGACPPSSKESFLIVSALCFIKILPTSVEPVKVNFLTRGSDNKVSPISDDGPTTILITPLGKPACSANSTNLRAVNGVSLEGLITTVQPAARAGPILRVNIAAGKFHGVIAATTPTGFFQTYNRLSGSWVGIVSP